MLYNRSIYASVCKCYDKDLRSVLVHRVSHVIINPIFIPKIVGLCWHRHSAVLD